MTLRDLYNDINSLLTSEGLDVSNIFFHDILHAINSSIDARRMEMVVDGMTTPFTVEKEIVVSIENRRVPYLNQAKLDRPPLKELPLQHTIVTAVAYRTPNRLSSKPKAWAVNDRVVMDNKLYEAFNYVPEIDSTDLTFKPTETQHYYVGCKYYEGDVLLSVDMQTMFRATGDFIASGDPATDPLEEVYWAEISDDATMEASILSYEEKASLKILPFAVTVNGEEIFMTPDIGRLYIEYVPVWEPVDDLEDELNLPMSLLDMVKNDTIRRLTPKLRTSQVEENE